MKKILTLLILCIATISFAGDNYGYKVGEKITDFRLRSASGEAVSLKDYPGKGFIIVFTSHTCPYSRAYDKRLLLMDSLFTRKGWPVIAINPNDPKVSEGDDFASMQTYAKDHNYTFPYLYDEGQKVATAFGAKATPMIFVVRKEKGEMIIKYAGAIDDNTWDDEDIKINYVERAISYLEQNKQPDITFTRALGCTIKCSIPMEGRSIDLDNKEKASAKTLPEGR